MKDTMSLLIATAILAAGGLGLYAYKSSDEGKEEGGYDEDILFGSNKDNEDVDYEYEDAEEDYEYAKPKPKPYSKVKGGKTKRTKKNVGTKRRYY